jgi:hypothetical protein
MDADGGYARGGANGAGRVVHLHAPGGAVRGGGGRLPRRNSEEGRDAVFFAVRIQAQRPIGVERKVRGGFESNRGNGLYMTLMKQIDYGGTDSLLPKTRRFTHALPLLVVWSREDSVARTIPVHRMPEKIWRRQKPGLGSFRK